MVEIVNGMMLGGYRIDRVLHGGNDQRKVVLALELSNENRPVVLKLAPLTEQGKASRLSREFEVLRHVACNGVVAALGYGVSLSNEIDYLVLTAHGPSLAEVLAATTEQRLPLEMGLAMAYAAATSVSQLHLQGWCHGDLKPGNLLCDRQGRVVLTDLEFAVQFADPSVAACDLQLAGTPPFMAPELWSAGTKAKSAASDVWALGVTLYLALFGEYPFGHGEPQPIREAIEQGPPPRLNELPELLRKLLLLMLDRDSTRRLADGKQAAAAIARTVSELGLYLAAGARGFAERVAAVPDEPRAPQAESSTVRPFESTPTGPPPSQPKTEVGLPPAAGPGSGTMPQPPSSPLRRASRPEGVGSGYTDDYSLLRRREFFDVASRAALAPPRPAVPMKPPSTMTSAATQTVSCPAPVGRTDSASERPTLARRAAARWYRRMNPDRNFPLSVVLSGKQIRIVGGSGLGITIGAKEILLDAQDPVLNIEPWFPGCIVSPPRADVHCTQDTTICRFWITPLVCDDLPEACVTIRYRGQVVETLATPSKVVTRTTAKVLATMGLVSPIAGKALDLAGWNPDDLLRDSIPYLGTFAARFGPVQSALMLTGALLFAAVVYYYITRPLLSDAEPKIVAAN